MNPHRQALRDVGLPDHTRGILCGCGSGLARRALHDGHNIFMCYVCDQCEATKVSGFRPDIFTAYRTDESIEADDGY